MRISPIRPAAGQRELSCAIIYFFPMNCIIHKARGRGRRTKKRGGGPVRAIQITKYNSIHTQHTHTIQLKRPDVIPGTLSVAK